MIDFQDILTQLRTIFDLIIDFQTAQSEFYEEANDELQARQHYEKLQQVRTQKVSVYSFSKIREICVTCLRVNKNCYYFRETGL